MLLSIVLLTMLPLHAQVSRAQQRWVLSDADNNMPSAQDSMCEAIDESTHTMWLLGGYPNVRKVLRMNYSMNLSQGNFENDSESSTFSIHWQQQRSLGEWVECVSQVSTVLPSMSMLYIWQGTYLSAFDMERLNLCACVCRVVSCRVMS